METIKKIVKKLIKNNYTISTMESCTGGELVNEITNIEGASDILKYSAITYSNEYKIKMGVSKSIIDKYSVYSMETAHEMSKKISDFTNSILGIGITGKLNAQDKNNLYGNDNIVYVSIYDKRLKKHYDKKIEVTKNTRRKNKKIVIDEIFALIEKNVL